jgi:hypothetical protein
VTAEAARRLAAEVLRPAHFFLGPGVELAWEHGAAKVGPWEVFQGRLLDPAHTRQRRTFEVWNVYRHSPEGRSGEPLLSLKLDAAAGELHVVRGVDGYVWEGYDAGGGVYQSRERRKWVRELVGTLRLARFADAEELRDELIGRLFQAVVGSSRLPLHTVETPLPAFTFGELFYCYRPDAPADAGPLRSPSELADILSPALAWREQAKLLEALLRAVPAGDVVTAAARWSGRWSALGRPASDLPALLRTLFNEVSLSPYTDFVDKALAFRGALEGQRVLPPAEAVDFLGHLLRQTGRHLTAFDLVTFHHRGANYPDALLLDAVLKVYLARIEDRPDLFLDADGDDESTRRRRRLRRRALRQGWLLRRRYEGHPVPDLPTSPGENARVMPPTHPRVPEEQLLQPARRQRRLYAGEPLPSPEQLGPRAREALRAAVRDLRHPDELRELGVGLFLDRPFGDAKAPVEPDQTLLLASEAFSRSVAETRLRQLAREPGLLDEASHAACRERLREEGFVRGLPVDRIGEPTRPGTVALTDARRAAPDFVFLWTVPSGVRALLELFDFRPLAARSDLGWLTGGGRVLVARASSGGRVRVYGADLRPRLELELPPGGGYESRGSVEYPATGVRAFLCDDETGGPENEPAVLLPS